MENERNEQPPHADKMLGGLTVLEFIEVMRWMHEQTRPSVTLMDVVKRLAQEEQRATL